MLKFLVLGALFLIPGTISMAQDKPASSCVTCCATAKCCPADCCGKTCCSKCPSCCKACTNPQCGK